MSKTDSTTERAPGGTSGADGSLHAVAEAIVDELLDGGRRLAIESHETRLNARGWGRQPMIDRVLKHLKANDEVSG